MSVFSAASLDLEDRINVSQGNRTVNIRLVDFNVQTLATVFKLASTTIYLTAENGDVVVSGNTGYMDVSPEIRYEVGGEEAPTNQLPAAAAPPPTSVPHQRLFLQRPAGGNAQPLPRQPKTFTKSIIVGRVVRGQLFTDDGSLHILLPEQDLSIDIVSAKVREELSLEEDVVLCHPSGQKIIDSSACRNAAFWKKSGSKIVALRESSYSQMQAHKKRRRSTLGEEARDRVEEFVLASEELPAISQGLRNITDYVQGNRVSTVALTEAQRKALKDLFQCFMCTEAIRIPIATPCCRCIVGCRRCVQKWLADHNMCPKCRNRTFKDRFFEMTGMEEVINIFQDIIE